MSRLVSGALLTSRDGIIGVTTVGGSSLIAVVENTENGHFGITSVMSSDDGKT